MYRFFMGAGCRSTHSDEVVLPSVPDGSGALSEKVREIIRLSLGGDLDFVFFCDSDTYVHVPRLMASGFETHDYVGCVGDSSVYDNKTMCCAGSGFWLSKKAMTHLKNAAIGENGLLGAGCDDWWIFHTLYRFGIFAFNDDRYRANRPIPGQGPTPENDYIILHDSSRSLRDPHLMREAHKAAKCL